MATKIRGTLDIGHGLGSDKHGINGWSETKSCMRIGIKVMNKLVSTGQFDIRLTKYTDAEDPSLTQRGRIAADFKSDFFLSIHENGFNGEAHGVSSFYSVDIPTDYPWAFDMAQRVAKAIDTNVRGAVTRASSNNFSSPDPSKLEDYYTVIDSAQDRGVPHVMLIECGFKDNPHDYAGISAPNGEERIAEAIAQSLCKMMGVTYHASTNPVTPPTPKPPKPDKTKTPRERAIDLLGKDKTVSKNDPRKALVKQIQQILIKKKYDLGKAGADGLFGSSTFRAVKEYQGDNRLVKDGIVGVETLTKLLS